MKKRVTTLIGIVIGILVFTLICCGLNYIYVTDSPWERILFHSYYEQDNIDNAFFGSSHVYCAVDPFRLDELNGDNNFNVSTSGQRWDDTYYLLRQAAADNDLKHVYLECSFWCSAGYDIWNDEEGKFTYTDYIDDPDNYSRAWNITDYMKPSADAARILAHSSNKDYAIETIFPFVRYRGNLFNADAIKENIKTKRSPDYHAYTYEADEKDIIGMDKHIEFRAKGFNYSRGGTLSDLRKLIEADRNLEAYGIGDKSEKYIRKSLDFCKKKGIPVTLFVAPIYDTQLIAAGDYDIYVSALRAIADEYGTEFYDFNLIKNEYLDIKHEEYFKDIGHLNGEGAKLFTTAMWEVLSNEPEENRDKFYDTYRDRLSGEPARIYGLYFKDLKEDGLLFTVASNRDDIKYRVTRAVTDDNYASEGPEEIVLDYGEGDSFLVPADVHGLITIKTETDKDSNGLQVLY